MGSGLILLVIVGAWLAVLVPMALRSHDQHSSERSPERFSDAMRVLSRRTGNERTALVPRRPEGTRAMLSADRTPVADRIASRSALLDRFTTETDEQPRVRRRSAVPKLSLPRRSRRRGPLTLADRRRRVLLVLLGLAVLAGLGSLVGPGLLRPVAVVLVALAVLFVVHCRRQAILKARRTTPAAVARRRAAPARRPATAAARAPRRIPRVAGVPERMPARPAALEAALPAPATRYDEPLAPAVGGSSWNPVPVPPPTYVGKPVAPPRPRRVLDLTRPGQWTAAMEADDSILAELEDGKDLDVILERRRAVGGW